jgi:putative transposon-encoded protein
MTREIRSMIATVTPRGTAGHVILPKTWNGKSIVARDEEGTRTKVTSKASKFGNSCHILLAKEWIGKHVYCKVSE